MSDATRRSDDQVRQGLEQARTIQTLAREIGRLRGALEHVARHPEDAEQIARGALCE